MYVHFELYYSSLRWDHLTRKLQDATSGALAADLRISNWPSLGLGSRNFGTLRTKAYKSLCIFGPWDHLQLDMTSKQFASSGFSRIKANMAPVATTEQAEVPGVQKLKEDASKVFNPFYSPSIGDDGDTSYKYAEFKPSFPNLSWPPLEEIQVTERGLHADPEKKALFSAAKKVRHYTPVIGTELDGIDLRQLSEAQKDELALLVAERGVVFFRDQDLTIHEQLDLARHFGPLHKHATTPIPKNGLEEVHIVYNDSSRRPDSSAFSKLELWHSDVTYEIQPPSITSLKVITGPEYGGDTLWSSGYALYSGLSPGFQKYLEGLSAVHSAVAQADGARAAGLPVRREPIETVHPVVRVNPATGWKTVYVNPGKIFVFLSRHLIHVVPNLYIGFTRRIVGIPKAESDAILSFLFHQLAENTDNQVRFHWEPNSIAIWDNRVVVHSATFDFWPATRHALRATPHGEKPISVEDYEKTTGKIAKDRQLEIWKQQGLDVQSNGVANPNKPRGYND
ncbi:hypothetical protein D9758_012152 [Tetrapyrgos nigripes]|uniref:TauD/TfdA-like domain-containing protein n=1 Tax=Tetrapyrgos nigripes TaxID=182062 RepID=A0A8H5FLD0_9AGAR|nr:hypothetical protein D9758_018709 [Tetrapyrgos nigripes]KAF5340872.1 hypothetical protein D9758_012152 [Tetrapyrgos nigripes]